MHPIAVMFGTVVAGLFVLSLRHRNLTTIVAFVLFAGWAFGQLAQTVSGIQIPLEVYWFADFVSAAIIFIAMARWHQWIAWPILALYSAMITCHWAIHKELLSPSEHYWLLTTMFAVQILLTGGRMIHERIRHTERPLWDWPSGQRLKSITLGNNREETS